MAFERVTRITSRQGATIDGIRIRLTKHICTKERIVEECILSVNEKIWKSSTQWKANQRIGIEIDPDDGLLRLSPDMHGFSLRVPKNNKGTSQIVVSCASFSDKAIKRLRKELKDGHRDLLYTVNKDTVLCNF